MQTVRIQTEGLTVKEVIDLEKLVAGLEGVADVKFFPVAPGTPITRSFPLVQAGIGILHLVIHVSEGAAIGIGAAAGNHIYKKVGEGIVDKVWDAVSPKLTGKSSVEVGVTLYGPDGEVLKHHKGRR